MGTLEVIRAFYPLRGICQPILVEACDHQIYILKLANNDHPRLLFNEALGSELFRFFGLPVPEWAVLALSDDFIDSHSQVWPVKGCAHVRPAAGLHFGSRLITSTASAGAYQMIPSSWIEHVVNREDFAAVLALDIWANHCDTRQAVYSHIGPGPSLGATFIDHGHMFGGPRGEKWARSRCSMMGDLRLYQGLDISSQLARWHKKIVDVSENTLWSIVAGVPECWQANGSAEQAVSMLRLRRMDLKWLFAEVVATLSATNSPLVRRSAMGSIAPRYGGAHAHVFKA